MVMATAAGSIVPGVDLRCQVCQSAADMSAPVRTALETAAKRYFEMSSRGDTDALKQNSIAAWLPVFPASKP